MNADQKIRLLGASARYDVCGSCWMDPVPRPGDKARPALRAEDFIARAVAVSSVPAHRGGTTTTAH